MELERYKGLIDEAIAWGHNKPHSKLVLGQYLRAAGITRERIRDPLFDRWSWCGEVLDAIKREAQDDLDAHDRVALQDYIDEVIDQPPKDLYFNLGPIDEHPSPLTRGLALVNPAPAGTHVTVRIEQHPKRGLPEYLWTIVDRDGVLLRSAGRAATPDDAESDARIAARGQRWHVERVLDVNLNPPRGVRAQKVITILDKDQAPIKKVVLDSTATLAEVLIPYLGKRATESFVALYLNARNVIVGYSEMHSNLQSGVEVGADGILRDCLLKGGIGIITAHNHPSGAADPSPDDRKLWARLRAAAEIVGLAVVDNCVVTDTELYSEMMEGTEQLPWAVRRELEQQAAEP